MKKIFIYTTMIIFAAAGCTDLTEDVSEAILHENYPETPEQLATLHLAAYEGLKELWDDNGYWYLTQEVSSDEMVAPRRGPHWFDGGKWLQLQYHNWNDESDPVWGMWRELSIGVSKANDVLGDFQSFEPNDEVNSKIAEITAVRSLYYYMLIDNFGDVPYITYLANEVVNPYRNYRHAIFDSLTMSLEHGLPYMKSLEEFPTYQNFASKEMAQALLAKLYLNGAIYGQEELPEYYENTIRYCDNLISNPAITLESNSMDPFKVSNSLTQEVIYSIPFHEVNKTGFRLHMRTLHYEHQATYDMMVGPWNGFCAIPSHLDTYEDNDARKAGFFQYGEQYDYSGGPLVVDDEQLYIDPVIPYPNMELGGSLSEEFITNCGARVQKFEIYQGARENLTVTFPFFRLPDVYLMKAEAEIRLNGFASQESIDNINAIRERAGVDLWSMGDVTLENVLAERGRELFAEGHRRNDLIRYGKFSGPLWGKGDGSDPSDPGANAEEDIFPIPLAARNTNPNLDLDPQ